MSYDEYTYVETATYRRGKSSGANRLVANIALNDKYLKHQYYEEVECRLCCGLARKKNTPGNFPFITVLSSFAILTIYILTFIDARTNQTGDESIGESIESELRNGTFSVLSFQGAKRAEAWRYFSYWLLHGNIAQVTCNLVLLLVLGIPLELVHGSVRVGILYFFGIVVGSMLAFILDLNCELIGATSGIYSLAFAWLITTVVNADSQSLMRTLCRLFPVILIIVFDTFVEALVFTQDSDWSKQILEKFAAATMNLSYAGYVAGATVGMSFGSCLLKNFSESMCESLAQKAVTVFWLMLLGGFILCQIVPITVSCHGTINLGLLELTSNCPNVTR